VTLRPADANEVVEAYRYVMQLRHQPAVLALSRQPLPTLDRRAFASAAGVARGAYVLADPPGGDPELVLIASGSEGELVVEAHENCSPRGFAPASSRCRRGRSSTSKRKEYRDSVLPPR
jgi:transketolase